ncbi:MAG TPA: hypothetical protein VLE96_01950 [Chlamydiales bacterium]|nr:hypothetical protein [Chlamydiales bacterium]
MKIFIFLLLFLCSSFANPTLQTFLLNGKSGDYIVTQAGKLFTVVHLRSIDENQLIIEEISGPNSFVTDSWASWVKNKAPGHTSWSILEIDSKNGQVLDCYSVSKNMHVKISKNESILATLLQLSLVPIQNEDRRRIGPPPLDGEPDFRKIWNPKFVFEKKTNHGTVCDAYTAIWPNDGSEIEGRSITLYFDQAHKIPFPCWIDIETTHVTGRIHVVDSGQNLVSPAFKKIGNKF